MAASDHRPRARSRTRHAAQHKKASSRSTYNIVSRLAWYRERLGARKQKHNNLELLLDRDTDSSRLKSGNC
jgi:hypothetical protein